ncbi:DUF4412 domain-containing protein [uncultured Cyclobacterium sp.]|uniref:DUF4412 domain-containing protein n=1 Tax=uncultured Cyclobacterium sp. TaxID=453820 RepID=UPI0030EF83C1|tara:strand:+ start:13984 stop:14613 length:630 start_codon:yes stop_codon:yes gene_type:complete
MKKLFAITILTLVLTSFTSDKETFVGKILYKYSFTDLKGNDITDQLVPYFGREQHYFIDNWNYKAYDEKNSWMQLYNSETNSYYYFNKDNTAQKHDGSTQTSQKFTVTKLDKKEKIAGYDCESIQVETDNATTIYYFNKTIKTDRKNFIEHEFGEWNKYLEATEGALSLKFVMTDHKNGFIWTSVATEVSKQKLTSSDFVFPADIKLKD